MAPEDTPGLRTFIEQNLGITLDAELVGRLEEGLGTTIDDDPARWRDVERNLAAAAGDDPDDSATVQPVLERLLDEASSGQPFEPLACLPDWTPGQQAIVATRVIQGEIDNRGAPAVFYNAVDSLLVDAIDGFRLLGLEEHANALADLVASGLSEDSPEGADDAFHEAWFSLPDTEPARAAYIRAHPEEFPA